MMFWAGRRAPKLRSYDSCAGVGLCRYRAPISHRAPCLVLGIPSCSLVVSQFRGLVLLMSSSLAVFGSRELLEGEVELTFEVLKSQT